MIKEIGVFVGDKGAAASIGDARQLRLYRKQQGVWRIDRMMDIDLGQAKNLASLRQTMETISLFLDECDIVAAECFQGAVVHELEKAGKGMWEISGLPEPLLLDHILAEEERSTNFDEKSNQLEYPEVENRGSGKLFISIAELQRNNAGMTSKQALLPIIQKGDFQELEVLCAHVPPWLEAEAACRRWSFVATKKERQEMLVTIRMSS